MTMLITIVAVLVGYIIPATVLRSILVKYHEESKHTLGGEDVVITVIPILNIVFIPVVILMFGDKRGDRSYVDKFFGVNKGGGRN